MNLGRWFSIVALVLSVMAAVVSILDNDTVELAFFVIMALAAATQAWCLGDPDVDWMRRTAKGIALAWLVAAVWIGVLLQMYQSASRPPPAAEETFLGLTATAFHVVAVYGGALLSLVAAFGPRRWGPWRRSP